MITIYGEVPSSKNSRIVTNKRSFPSKFCSQYIKNTELQWIANKQAFLKSVKGLEKPYYVEFKFYRRTKARFDLINILQVIQDMMVKHKWIDDDNYNELVPVFKMPVEVDKENPRVEISISPKGESK